MIAHGSRAAQAALPQVDSAAHVYAMPDAPASLAQTANPGAVPAAAANLAGAAGCTCFKLRSLSRRVTQLYDQTLAPAGLKVTQYSLLAHARRRPGLAAPGVGELSRALFTDRTTLTRNLKPLIDCGLVELGHGNDARSKAVKVTAAGEAAFQAARPLWRQAQDRLRAAVGAPQVAALHLLIDRLLPHLPGSDGAVDA